MNLSKFFFPVEEKPIALSDNLQPLAGYKAIVSPQNGQVKPISVVKDTYQLVPNKQIIKPFLQQIQELNAKWYIDSSHTFVTLSRMRLQITFPELCMQDSESLIPLSLYLHNSYNMSEGIRVFFGAIRLACQNGMVLGHIISSFYGRHTKGFAFERLAVEFDKALEKIDDLQSRINHLENVPMSQDRYECLQQSLGKKRISEILNPETSLKRSQWDAYNRITRFISHEVPMDRRADLQQKLSGVFQL